MPLAAGLQGLFGQAPGAAHLVYANTFVGKAPKGNEAKNTLRSGYIAILRTPEVAVENVRLFVVNNELRVGTSVKDNDAFDACDYMLLHGKRRTARRSPSSSASS